MEFLLAGVLCGKVCHEAFYILLCKLIHSVYLFYIKWASFDLRFKAGPEFVYPCKFANFCEKMQYLEEESDVDVEGAVSILLVEAAGIFEGYNEVFIHDEPQSCTC